MMVSRVNLLTCRVILLSRSNFLKRQNGIDNNIKQNPSRHLSKADPVRLTANKECCCSLWGPRKLCMNCHLEAHPALILCLCNSYYDLPLQETHTGIHTATCVCKPTYIQLLKLCPEFYPVNSQADQSFITAT